MRNDCSMEQFGSQRLWKLDRFSITSVQFSSVAQSCPTLCDPMSCSTPGLPVHHQLPESIESVMPSSHLILCRPLLLLPPIPPSIRVFSNESTLLMRWPKYWNFSFNIIPSKEIPGLISFRMAWVVPHSEGPRFPGPLLIRTRCADTSPNSTLWMKSTRMASFSVHRSGKDPRFQRQLDKRPLSPGTSREASGVPCLNPRRGLTLLSPVCRDPAIGVWSEVLCGSCLNWKWVHQGCILSPWLFNLYAAHHEKWWAGWNTSWNQDCQEKYQ